MIVQGDNGTVISLYILKGVDPLPLTDCTVKIAFKSKNARFEKNAEIIDENTGYVRVFLTRDDLAESGKYEFQASVLFQNGNEFHTKIMNFNVEKKL